MSKSLFDSDARRSSPKIHFVGFKTLVQNLLWILGNLMFDKRKLNEANITLKIGSDWIRLDQIGSDDLRMTWGWLKDDLGIWWSTLNTLAACFIEIQKLWGFGRQVGMVNSGAFGVLVSIFPCPCSPLFNYHFKKKKKKKKNLCFLPTFFVAAYDCFCSSIKC